MQIAGRDLMEGPPLLIAEVGNNHEGDPAVARQLVEAAAEAGADAVKLQTFRTESLVRRRDKARFAQLERFRLSQDVIGELADLARQRGLLFLSTPLDLASVGFLEPLVDAFKIASGDNDFVPLLNRVAETGRPVVMSTGLSDLAGVHAAVDLVRARWQGEAIEQDLAVLHCVTAYPIALDRANLAAIEVLARELGVVAGYSDHTIGLAAPVVAAALGARIVEKHFTLRHDFSEFRDHQLSATPDELTALAATLRAVPGMVGRPVKEVQEEASTLVTAVRRSIAASRDLATGHVLTFSDLAWLRPRDGLEPGREDELLGRVLRRAVLAGESIMPEDVA